MTLYILIILVLLILLYQLLVKPHFLWKKRGIKQPTICEILGDNFKSLLGIESITSKLKKLHQRFPNLRYYGIYQLGLPLLLIRDPEVIKDMTVRHSDHFVDHRNFGSDNETDTFSTRNIFALKGENWKRMRSVLSPTFTGSKMRVLFDLIDQTAQKYVDYYLNNAKDLIELEVRDSIGRFATDVIASCAFGFENDSLNNANNEFIVSTNGINNTTFTATIKMLLNMNCPKFAKLLGMDLIPFNVIQFFKNITQNVISLRKEKNIYRPDMIHILMEVQKQAEKGNEKAIKLMDDDIVAQLMIFVIGGFETVSTSLTFALYELALNPDVQKQLQEEIDITLKASNGQLSYDLIKEMKYLNMVVSETLRKWPGGPQTDRVCTKAFTIKPEHEDEKEITLQEGEVALINIYGLHHDPLYFPEPDRFDPERFNDTNKKNIHPYAYLPFGSGPRNCLGDRFALMEMKIILTRFLSKFNVVVTEKTEIPLRFAATELMIKPKNGIWLGYKKRN